jgi:CheY-like chemotaxis protein
VIREPEASAMHHHIIEQSQPVAEAVCRRTILIVEDDPSIAEVLSIRLDQQGYDSHCAGTGAEAMKLARRHQPHLALLDLRLPDVDGFALCQQMDDDPETCAIPKIVLSGMERPDIIRATRSAGCKFFVRKPYDPNALLILIEQAISETEQW